MCSHVAVTVTAITRSTSRWTLLTYVFVFHRRCRLPFLLRCSLAGMRMPAGKFISQLIAAALSLLLTCHYWSRRKYRGDFMEQQKSGKRKRLISSGRSLVLRRKPPRSGVANRSLIDSDLRLATQHAFGCKPRLAKRLVWHAVIENYPDRTLGTRLASQIHEGEYVLDPHFFISSLEFAQQTRYTIVPSMTVKRSVCISHKN